MTNKQLGVIIKNRRQRLALTQKDVAEITGITYKSISDIELGIRNPSFDNINKILEVLGLEITIGVKELN